MSGSANPFVGPRPLEAGERVWGRDREVDELDDELSSQRVVHRVDSARTRHRSRAQDAHSSGLSGPASAGSVGPVSGGDHRLGLGSPAQLVIAPKAAAAANKRQTMEQCTSLPQLTTAPAPRSSSAKIHDSR